MRGWGRGGRSTTLRRTAAALVILVAVAALVGCAPSAPPAGYASGCGKPAAPVYLQQRLLRSSGVVRTFLLTIPVGYDPNAPTPLVLNFHGSGSSAAEQSAYSQLDAKGMQRGFIVATPDGIDHEWLVGDAPADLAFAQDLVHYLDSILCVSPTSRFAAGLSRGGQMVSELACQPDLGLRAIAGVTALFPACANGRTMPVISFQGTLDTHVPYAFVQSAVASWASRDGCRAKPAEARIGTDVVEQTYSGCAPSLSVVFYTVEGGGHTWPGGLIDLPPEVFGATTHTINASDLILDFFAAQ
jgi:polyhydroxybutyrate depolymerase